MTPLPVWNSKVHANPNTSQDPDRIVEFEPLSAFPQHRIAYPPSSPLQENVQYELQLRRYYGNQGLPSSHTSHNSSHTVASDRTLPAANSFRVCKYCPHFASDRTLPAAGSFRVCKYCPHCGACLDPQMFGQALKYRKSKKSRNFKKSRKSRKTRKSRKSRK